MVGALIFLIKSILNPFDANGDSSPPAPSITEKSQFGNDLNLVR